MSDLAPESEIQLFFTLQSWAKDIQKPSDIHNNDQIHSLPTYLKILCLPTAWMRFTCNMWANNN